MGQKCPVHRFACINHEIMIQPVFYYYDECLNASHVSPWAEHLFLLKSGQVPRVLRSEPEPEEEVVDLVQEGITMAIAAEADPVYDFYLMRVKGKILLSEAVTDDYGLEHPPNTKIIRGAFLSKLKCVRHDLQA